MLGKPRILSLFPNSFNKLKKKKHEHSCKILYVSVSSEYPLVNQHIGAHRILFSSLETVKVARQENDCL